MGKLLSTLVGLLSLAAIGWAQKPSTADTEALIEKSRQVSLADARSLPDFVYRRIRRHSEEHLDPTSQTSFRWEGWKTVHRRPVGVYVYQVGETHSNYYLEVGTCEDVRRAIASFHGTIEIDRDTGEVLHLDHVAGRIPQELRMSKAITEVDYDAVGVAGNRYLLPIQSQTTLERKTGSWKNESEFRDYRKFDANSTVDYGPGK